MPLCLQGLYTDVMLACSYKQQDHQTPPPLPTIVIGKRDLTMEADSVQDLEALADVLLLWDQRDKASAVESVRERRTGSLACKS